MRYHFDDGLRSHYQKSGIEKVDGWLAAGDQILISSLCEIQRQNKCHGSVGEIGVHHGRLFILLYLHLHEGERAFCVDVFENQDLNIDRSGAGDESIFLANVGTYADASRLSVFKQSSLNIDPARIIEKVGAARIISIDGGHTKDITQSDLRKSREILSPDGVIMVDDYFNPAWPGVSEGVNAYFNAPGGALSPFAIGLNKIFFCRPNLHAFYRDKLRQGCPEMYLKATEFLGHEVDVFAGYDRLSNILGYTRLRAFGRAARHLEDTRDRLRNWLAIRTRG